MTRRRTGSLGGALLLATGLGSLAACGDAAGEISACADILPVVSEATGKIRDLAADPDAAIEELRGVADDLRAVAADTTAEDVQSAAAGLADVYDEIVTGVETGAVPDIDTVTAATTALADACAPEL